MPAADGGPGGAAALQDAHLTTSSCCGQPGARPCQVALQGVQLCRDRHPSTWAHRTEELFAVRYQALALTSPSCSSSCLSHFLLLVRRLGEGQVNGKLSAAQGVDGISPPLLYSLVLSLAQLMALLCLVFVKLLKPLVSNLGYRQPDWPHMRASLLAMIKI